MSCITGASGPIEESMNVASGDTFMEVRCAFAQKELGRCWAATLLLLDWSWSKEESDLVRKAKDCLEATNDHAPSTNRAIVTMKREQISFIIRIRSKRDGAFAEKCVLCLKKWTFTVFYGNIRAMWDDADRNIKFGLDIIILQHQRTATDIGRIQVDLRTISTPSRLLGLGNQISPSTGHNKI